MNSLGTFGLPVQGHAKKGKRIFFWPEPVAFQRVYDT